MARAPLFFTELTVAPSAPRATIWFLNSGRPRKRVKKNKLFFNKKLFSITFFFAEVNYPTSLFPSACVYIFWAARAKYLALADYKKQVQALWMRFQILWVMLFFWNIFTCSNSGILSFIFLFMQINLKTHNTRRLLSGVTKLKKIFSQKE